MSGPAHDVQYAAFISYSHADSGWAHRLQAFLERYRVPAELRRDGAATPLAPVFVDDTELTSGNLDTEIDNALAHSAALVVVCSPAAAQSRWVDLEIRRFRSLHPQRPVLSLLVAGDPDSNATSAASFPAALLHDVTADGSLGPRTHTPLAADVRPGHGRPRPAFLRLAAALLGVGLDQLLHRDQQVRQRRLLAAVAGTAALAILTTTLAIRATLAQTEAEQMRAEADELIGFMLGDLRTRLEPIGRTDVLDAVGDRAMAYFASLDGEDDDAAALGLRALALRQIGEVRVQQGRVEDAQQAFTSSLDLFRRADSLQPGDADLRLQLAHAHFWLADAHLRQGDLAGAMAGIASYRDLAGDLVAMQPERVEHQVEWLSAHVNLGALAYRQADFASASQSFRAAVAAAGRVPAYRHPEVRRVVAAAHGWLGAIEDAADRKDAAVAAQHASVQTWQGLWDELGNRNDQQALLNARLILANLLARRGDLPEAQQAYRATLDDASGLIRHDPENAVWRTLQAKVQAGWAQTQVIHCLGSPDTTHLLEAAAETYTQTLRMEADAVDPALRLAAVHADRAHLALQHGDPEAAARHLATARSSLPPNSRDLANDPLRARWLLRIDEVALLVARARGAGDEVDRLQRYLAQAGAMAADRDAAARAVLARVRNTSNSPHCADSPAAQQKTATAVTLFRAPPQDVRS